MFCTTFSEKSSEDIPDINVGGCLGPLYCQVLPKDDLYRPFSSSLIELSTADGEGACVMMGKILLDINMAVLEENGSFSDGTRLQINSKYGFFIGHNCS